MTVSDSIKQYIENWADEETASEMNQIETNRYNKEGLRIRDDQLSETVYTINASELQYLEPLVESENGIPLVSFFFNNNRDIFLLCCIVNVKLILRRLLNINSQKLKIRYERVEKKLKPP